MEKCLLSSRRTADVDTDATAEVPHGSHVGDALYKRTGVVKLGPVDVARGISGGSGAGIPHGRRGVGVETAREEVVGFEDRRDVKFVDGDRDAHVKELRSFDYGSPDLQQVRFVQDFECATVYEQLLLRWVQGKATRSSH